MRAPGPGIPMFNVVQLLTAKSSGSHSVYPRQYLHAALETIVITLIVTWAFTWKFHPDQIWKHPKFITLGAFNYCFSWYATHLSPTSHPPARLSQRVCPSGTFLRETSSLPF